jgi:hypothetical protein
MLLETELIEGGDGGDGGDEGGDTAACGVVIRLDVVVVNEVEVAIDVSRQRWRWGWRVYRRIVGEKLDC